LPIVVGNVPGIAEVIEGNKAGKSIDFDKEKLKDAIDIIIQNHKTYRANTI